MSADPTGAAGPPREPSPLNPQPIVARGPFFQGWLVRVIDHDRGRSVILIVASFSRAGSPTFDQHYVYSAVTVGDATRAFKAFPEPRSVEVEGDGRRPGVDLRWTAAHVGALRFDDLRASAEMRFGDALSLSLDVTNRKAWKEEGSLSRGPEGWLGRTRLLPSRYFIHSVGSDAEYSLRLDGREVAGRGFAHVECNYGNFFPRGWVWAQAIAPDNASSFSLVIGKIAVGPLEPFIGTFYLRRKDGRTAVFRTTDLDRVRYVLDGQRKGARLELASRFTRRRATVRIEARDRAFHKVFVPTPAGMSDDPGCEETYTATAVVTYEEADAPAETYTFPLTAFELGGSFLGAVHQNAPLD